jgi:hypothetical protein
VQLQGEKEMRNAALPEWKTRERRSADNILSTRDFTHLAPFYCLLFLNRCSLYSRLIV